MTTTDARARGRYAEVPEVPRHRRMSRGRKPWSLEYRSRPRDPGRWIAFPDWTPVKRYRTEEDARKAMATITRNHGDLWELRIVGPDGEVLYGDD